MDIDWDAQPFGEVSDADLARRLGVSRPCVGQQRRKRGIDRYPYRYRYKTPDDHKMVNDDEIAEYIALLGVGLRRMREEHGVTQDQVATRAGIPTDVISRLENARYVSPGLRTLLRISMALHVDLSDLLPTSSQKHWSPGFLLRVETQIEKLSNTVRAEREKKSRPMSAATKADLKESH